MSGNTMHQRVAIGLLRSHGSCSVVRCSCADRLTALDEPSSCLALSVRRFFQRSIPHLSIVSSNVRSLLQLSAPLVCRHLVNSLFRVDASTMDVPVTCQLKRYPSSSIVSPVLCTFSGVLCTFSDALVNRLLTQRQQMRPLIVDLCCPTTVGSTNSHSSNASI